MNENVVFDSAKKAGTFFGKTIACFAAGVMLVADTATRKRYYTTGNVNPIAPKAESAASGKRSRFFCRQCGTPIDVKSFRLAHGYTPGKGFLCDRCHAEKLGVFYRAGDSEKLSTVCADCGKEIRAKSFRDLRKHCVDKAYYCKACYRKHY